MFVSVALPILVRSIEHLVPRPYFPFHPLSNFDPWYWLVISMSYGVVCVHVFSTAIHTAAMDMLGGAGVESQCRKVDIIADAAYSIFKRPKSFTGNFIIDENILKEEGIKDFDIYAITPGNTYTS